MGIIGGNFRFQWPLQLCTSLYFLIMLIYFPSIYSHLTLMTLLESFVAKAKILLWTQQLWSWNPAQDLYPKSFRMSILILLMTMRSKRYSTQIQSLSLILMNLTTSINFVLRAMDIVSSFSSTQFLIFFSFMLCNFCRCQIWYRMQGILCLHFCQFSSANGPVFWMSRWFIFWWFNPSMWIWQAWRLWTTTYPTCKFYYCCNY